MPGNPEECCRHALECVRLAQSTAIPHEGNISPSSLEHGWLADELERSRELLDDELDEPAKRTG
jgi:hypothetical protein